MNFAEFVEVNPWEDEHEPWSLKEDNTKESRIWRLEATTFVRTAVITHIFSYNWDNSEE